MAASTQQKSTFITAARAAMTQLYEASAQCRHILDMGTDMGLVPSGLVDADFINDNSGLAAADFQAAVAAANHAVSAADRAAIAKSKL